jgi:hypothetical protein
MAKKLCTTAIALSALVKFVVGKCRQFRNDITKSFPFPLMMLLLVLVFGDVV